MLVVDGPNEALSSLPSLPNIEMHFKEPSTLVIVASDVRASEPVQPKFARPSFQSTLPAAVEIEIGRSRKERVGVT